MNAAQELLRVAKEVLAAGETLKVGDSVISRFSDEPVKVIGMALVAEQRSKDEVAKIKEAPWELVKQNWVILSLDNHHWAYGEQVEPVR